MKTKTYQMFVVLTSLAFAMASCSKPTKCECKAELDKSLTQTAMTGKPVITALNKKCDKVYNGAEAYMNENCPEK